MSSIVQWLSNYGLTSTQIRVYICILKHPEVKVSEIQRQTGLVRTTIYYTLGQLKADGLISESLQNNVKSYRATDSKNLQHNVENVLAEQKQKLDALKELEPLFSKLAAADGTEESFVSRYEGTSAVKQAIEAALRCDSKRWLVVASRNNFLHYTSKQYQNYYLSERKRRGITSKTLWEPVKEFSAPSVEDVFYRNPRRLPAEFLGAFNALIIIYDDTTLIIDPYEQKTAHAIHNATGTQLMRLMFEAIWAQAETN